MRTEYRVEMKIGLVSIEKKNTVNKLIKLNNGNQTNYCWIFATLHVTDSKIVASR